MPSPTPQQMAAEQTRVPLPMVSTGIGRRVSWGRAPVPGPIDCKSRIDAWLRSPLPEAARLDPCPALFSLGELIRDPILQANKGG